ncbi:peptidase A24 [Thermosipho melanesiensis]|uniref:Peptidase A24A domain protein n=2 Tax=Thermosipho melanesiensis TaxID=46541 RepID=A6LNX9_THEM4|nr:A24 family peptidase [Thermosipho melanesiensis]ABR31630.1 peptidase A24A domain protein [Thermosipho melanesiensis BI429]APT74659.1 peptidase A24 [Thermosipho melanesiensis]OOC35158.1 peptidase A24 [Thermosipho melanesiensis]OOC35368.1 peptidase A24 [Thermosipho melanesiensis]OOC36619.1 peptidase A24 [Thermosipho melanesiensis]
MWYVLNFILGAIFGSFLNVILFRSVEGLKINDPPRSFCLNCKVSIKWYDNIPILSYILLGGKCRNCKTKIPIRYFLVELLIAFSFTFHSLLFAKFECILLNIFIFSTVVVAYVDFKIMMIPDFSWWLLWIVSVLDLFRDTRFWYLRFVSLFIVLSIFLILKKIYVEGLGEGDIYLITPIAFILNLPLSIYHLLLSSILALIFSLVNKKKIVPFGPFISISGYVLYVFMLKYF